jgi:hypothetical protein
MNNPVTVNDIKNQTPFKNFLAATIKKDFLFRIFARKRTQSIWRILPPPKIRQIRKAESDTPTH